jgi:hypothetical protein
MQKQTFPCGGYVLHKMPLSNGGKASAWFSKYGMLEDVEAYSKNGHKFHTKLMGPLWKEIEKKGCGA